MISKVFSIMCLSAIVLLLSVACEPPVDKSFESRFFIKYYGEDGDQRAVDMVANNDGSVTLLSKTSVGDKAMLVISADPQGTIIWQKNFGTKDDSPVRIVATVGGYVVLSEIMQSDGTTDFKLTEIDAAGNEGISITNGTVFNDHPLGITSLNDGGYIISGYSEFDWQPTQNLNRTTSNMHFRCDANFVFQNTDWMNSSGQGSTNAVTSVIENGDSLYVFATTNAVSGQNPLGHDVITYFGLGKNGPQEGVNYLGDKTTCTSVIATSPVVSDGYFILGTETPTSNASIRVSKLRNPLHFNSNADILFSKDVAVGNLGSSRGVACVESRVGIPGFLVASSVSNIAAQSNVVVSKFDSGGELIWSVPFGSSKNDEAASVAELSDGRILVFCTIQMDIQYKLALFKVNSNGQFAD